MLDLAYLQDLSPSSLLLWTIAVPHYRRGADIRAF